MLHRGRFKALPDCSGTIAKDLSRTPVLLELKPIVMAKGRTSGSSSLLRVRLVVVIACGVRSASVCASLVFGPACICPANGFVCGSKIESQYLEDLKSWTSVRLSDRCTASVVERAPSHRAQHFFPEERTSSNLDANWAPGLFISSNVL